MQIVGKGSRAVYLAADARNQTNYLDFAIRKPPPTLMVARSVTGTGRAAGMRKPPPTVSGDLATTGTALTLGSRKPPPRVGDALPTTGAVLTDGSRKPPPRTTAVTSVGQGDTAAET